VLKTNFFIILFLSLFCQEAELFFEKIIQGSPSLTSLPRPFAFFLKIALSFALFPSSAQGLSELPFGIVDVNGQRSSSFHSHFLFPGSSSSSLTRLRVYVTMVPEIFPEIIIY
jgi:hypothetical protein